jgi:hypothetical protein
VNFLKGKTKPRSLPKAVCRTRNGKPNSAPTQSKAGWLSMVTSSKRSTRRDDGMPQSLDVDSVHYSRPERHATTTTSMDVIDDDTVLRRLNALGAGQGAAAIERVE